MYCLHNFDVNKLKAVVRACLVRMAKCILGSSLACTDSIETSQLQKLKVVSCLFGGSGGHR